jgi:hypothetical protein
MGPIFASMVKRRARSVTNLFVSINLLDYLTEGAIIDRGQGKFDPGTESTIQPIEKATTFKSNDRMSVLKDSERAYPWI